MERRKLEKLNIETSLLGFGAMRLAIKSDGSIDYETSGKMIDIAMAGGVNYFDTAYVYHSQKSEVFLGEMLTSRYPRDSFYLATKLPTFRVNKANEMDEMLNESLKRLKTDYIDFYLMHSLNWGSWEKMKSIGVVDFIKRAKDSGKIHRIGFSFHSGEEDFQKIIDDYPEWEFIQLQINYADWDTKPGIRACYEIAEKAGIPIIVMEPVRGGALANPNAPAVKMISGLLEPGVTPASIALRWVAGLKAVNIILSGMSAISHIEENIKTFSPVVPLSAGEQNAIKETIGVMKSFPTIPCTACAYCLESCPNEIPIDDLFDSFNDYLYYENKRRFTQFYPDTGNRPSDCIGCGACVSVCPQHIDVIAELKRVEHLFNSL